MLRSSSARLSSGLLKKFQRCTSTINPAATPDKVSDDVQDPNNTGVSNVIKKELQSIDAPVDQQNSKGSSKLVVNAFASLQKKTPYLPSRGPLDETILQAKTPEELLAISNNSVLTKRQALKIVTLLTNLSLNGKGDDFESDPRFVALCQMVMRDQSLRNSTSLKESGDLSVVLGVMGEDEAAKMINSITLPQMIKVLSSLSFKRRRSLPLLKALSFNISRSHCKLDVKQSADILYALASLNFPDEVLLEKVCCDLLETIPPCLKSAVIGSICTSIGLLRYKDVDLLDTLSSWVLQNKSITRSQDFVSLLLCLASVKQVPSNGVIEVIVSNISEEDVSSTSMWLDVVWSLAVLESASESLISSVLQPKFIERLSTTSGRLSTSWKRKLLNVNGLAKLMKGYKGPFIKDETEFEVPYTRSKDKQNLLTSVIDTLTNLFPSTNHFRTSIDTGMGFLIDAECMFDPKMNPVPLVDKKTGQPLQLNGKRLALLVHDYHECTRGRVEPNGATSFYLHLASLSGYKVISVLYTDYRPQSKLLERAKYIDGLLKSAAAPPV